MTCVNYYPARAWPIITECSEMYELVTETRAASEQLHQSFIQRNYIFLEIL